MIYSWGEWPSPFHNINLADLSINIKIVISTCYVIFFKEEVHARERKKQTLECVNTLPNSPCIVVHPSATAKGGKFDCSVMSLSLLLDYRPEDNKEHSFEVSLAIASISELSIDFRFKFNLASLA